MNVKCAFLNPYGNIVTYVKEWILVPYITGMVMSDFHAKLSTIKWD